MLPPVHIIRARDGDFLTFSEMQGISGALFAHGTWDLLIVHLAQGFIQCSDKKPLVLDIGGNMGTFTVPIARFIKDKGGSLIAFEPQKTIFYQLCGNVFLNRIDNVTIHNIALSNKSGIYPIATVDYAKAWNIGAFSIVQDLRQPVTERTENCVFAKIDEFDIDGQITLIKIDVEGSEFDVLSSGMKRISTDGYPPIIFECNPNDENKKLLFELLEDSGYLISQIIGMDGDFFAQHPNWSSEISMQNINGSIGLSRVR